MYLLIGQSSSDLSTVFYEVEKSRMAFGFGFYNTREQA